MTALTKKILVTGSLVMVLAMVIFASVKLTNVDAKSTGDEPLYKYYKSYEIQPGDTLTSIAAEYTANTQVSVKEYIEEVRENNRLYKDTIVAGKKIVVAYYSDEYK